MRNMPDPQQLLASAYRFAGVANGITASAGRLRSSTIQLNEVWTGQGGEAFERVSATCLSDIDILPKVIQFTITALNQYALRIEEAQSLYDQARELYAEAAASTGAEAANLYRQAAQKEREGDLVFDAADRTASNSFREIGMMTSQMKGKLHPVANLSTRKKPGFWEQVGNAFKDIGNGIEEAEQWMEGEEVKAGEWIGKEAEDIWKNRYTYMEDLSKVLEGVSAVSGILALAMVWFPPAAGVLETISLASAGAAAADDAILLASGHGSAETFVEDAVSVVPGGAAIGVGKAIKYAKEARVAEEVVEGAGDVVKGSEQELIKEAQQDQINSGYHPDKWAATTLRKGGNVVGGTPGQTGYYTDLNSLKKSEGSKEALWQGLQVNPHPVLGYRTQVTVYEVTEDVQVPTGTAEANWKYGEGGYTQYFIQDYSKYLKPIKTIQLR